MQEAQHNVVPVPARPGPCAIWGAALLAALALGACSSGFVGTGPAGATAGTPARTGGNTGDPGPRGAAQAQDENGRGGAADAVEGACGVRSAPGGTTGGPGASAGF